MFKEKCCWLANHSQGKRLDPQKRNKSFRQFPANFADDDEADPSEIRLVNHLEEFKAHFVEFSLKDDNNAGNMTEIIIAYTDAKDNSTSSLALLLNPITLHSFQVQPYNSTMKTSFSEFSLIRAVCEPVVEVSSITAHTVHT